MSEFNKEALMNVSSSDAVGKIVNSLMFFRQGGETEAFAKCAIESLVKKLKDKQDELDALIVSVVTGGSQTTKCCTVPRTLDGRVQIAGKKCFPHLMYTRIWRWNDLNRFELKCLSNCFYGYEMKLDSICINPYHYERIVGCGEMPSLNMSPLLDVGEKECGSDNETDDLKSHGESIESAKNSTFYDGQSIDMDRHSMGSIRMNQSSSQITSEADNEDLSKRNFLANNTWENGTSKSIHDQPPGSHEPPSSAQPPVNSSTLNNGMLPSSGRIMTNSSRSNSNSNLANPISTSQANLPKAAQNMSQTGGGMTPMKAPEYWCSIAYFELDQQVGELFKVRSQHSRVTVDGYTDPSSPNRFCLGQLSNVHRSDQSEKSRLYIGKGVELDNVGEGDVWIRCLSELSVFVQSYYLDREAGRNPGDAVHKIYPGAYIKIFDIRQCHQQMRQLAQTAQAAAIRQAAAVVGTMALPPQNSLLPSSSLGSAAGVGVDDLRRLCMLRLSFVKGWGPDYPRATIKETPCWIEIQLHRPLQLLDEVLQAMPLNDLKPSRQFFPNFYNNSQQQQQRPQPGKYPQNNFPISSHYHQNIPPQAPLNTMVPMNAQKGPDLHQQQLQPMQTQPSFPRQPAPQQQQQVMPDMMSSYLAMNGPPPGQQQPVGMAHQTIQHL